MLPISRRFVFAYLGVMGLGIAATVACSRQSPAEPSAATGPVGGPSLSAQSVPGKYELTFRSHQNVTVWSLPAGEELVLHAHVADPSGVPAPSGSVAFQVCSRSGGRSFTRMDPAPYEECNGGSGTWVHLVTLKVDAGTCPAYPGPGYEGPGNACANFGAIRNPRTVGFRFKYSGQGSGIANGVGGPLNFVWE